jgi:MoxR-like ATPase
MDILQQAVALAPKVQGVSDDVCLRHIGRHDVAHSAFLALATARPAFYLGSPGVDKTNTVQDLARRISGAVFYDALMPTVTSADQLLVESILIEEHPTPDGGKSIRMRGTLGRAAGAHIVFADEIWKSEPSVLNPLIDLAKGDGVRHEGRMEPTPLLAFLAASNELPDPSGNLGAVWSRMTLRVPVRSLDRAGKLRMVEARLQYSRVGKSGGASAPTLTLDEIGVLRVARPHVEVSSDIRDIVLDVYKTLLEKHPDGAYQWLRDDDRRFGRVFDVLQAEALLAGRTMVTKQDLQVLRWLLWDTTEQIAEVEGVVAPLCRTPSGEAQEFLDALLTAGGVVDAVLNGSGGRETDALQQCRQAVQAIEALHTATSGSERDAVQRVAEQARAIRQQVANKVAGI